MERLDMKDHPLLYSITYPWPHLFLLRISLSTICSASAELRLLWSRKRPRQTSTRCQHPRWCAPRNQTLGVWPWEDGWAEEWAGEWVWVSGGWMDQWMDELEGGRGKTKERIYSTTDTRADSITIYIYIYICVCNNSIIHKTLQSNFQLTQTHISIAWP